MDVVLLLGVEVEVWIGLLTRLRPVDGIIEKVIEIDNWSAAVGWYRGETPHAGDGGKNEEEELLDHAARP